MEYCPLISDSFIDDVLATTMSKKKDYINALFAFFSIFTKCFLVYLTYTRKRLVSKK